MILYQPLPLPNHSAVIQSSCPLLLVAGTTHMVTFLRSASKVDLKFLLWISCCFISSSNFASCVSFQRHGAASCDAFLRRCYFSRRRGKGRATKNYRSSISSPCRLHSFKGCSFLYHMIAWDAMPYEAIIIWSQKRVSTSKWHDLNSLRISQY